MMLCVPNGQLPRKYRNDGGGGGGGGVTSIREGWKGRKPYHVKYLSFRCMYLDLLWLVGTPYKRN